MKTQITIGADQINIGTLMLFFICFFFSFNSHSQKVHMSLTETWKNETWENTSKTFNTYDGNGYLTNDLSQSFDVSTWKDQYRTNYTNNPDGTAQQSISQLWDTDTNAWQNLGRTTNTYNAAKKVLTTVSEFWFAPDWMSASKQIHTYDGNNYLTKSLSQSYDFISPWKGSFQTTYTNNPDGTVSQSVSERWNFTAWVYTDRITYTYLNSKLITSLDEKWNGTIWQNFSMDTNEYDTNGNLKETLSKKWAAGNWVNDSKTIYTNNGNTLFQIVSQDWDDTGLAWKNTLRLTFNYNALGVDEPVFDKSFTLYPNPAQDKITIKTAADHVGVKYLVADQLGRQFSNGTITDMETVINVDQFSAGIYYIQMGQNKNETIKMVKK